MNRRFLLDLFVVDHSGTKVPVNMFGATEQDIEKTDSWMTYWGSDYILDSKHENYAMKTKDDELIALVSYEIMKNRLVVHIVYMESQRFKGDIPCSILIADNAAVNIVSEYIAQEE